MIYNFENGYILIFCIIFLLSLNIIGFVKNKANYPMISLVFFMGSLIVHVANRDILASSFNYNMYLDLIAVAISISNMLITDEIETRRTIIKGVFENRYKKK